MTTSHCEEREGRENRPGQRSTLKNPLAGQTVVLRVRTAHLPNLPRLLPDAAFSQVTCFKAVYLLLDWNDSENQKPVSICQMWGRGERGSRELAGPWEALRALLGISGDRVLKHSFSTLDENLKVTW